MTNLIHPRECTCEPVAFSSVTYHDTETKTNVTRTIALRSIRSRTCPVHCPQNERRNAPIKYRSNYVRKER